MDRLPVSHAEVKPDALGNEDDIQDYEELSGIALPARHCFS
jgi:hypothetical protein